MQRILWTGQKSDEQTLKKIVMKHYLKRVGLVTIADKRSISEQKL